nr:reverse transcriptase domain-containing protein [Tanacetum cinerariifolium]
MQITQPGMNMGQDRQMQMIGGNGGNQFRQNTRNLNSKHRPRVLRLTAYDTDGSAETFLRTPDELSNSDDDYYDTEGYILYIEKLLNEDPSSNLPPVKNEDLKQVNATMTKPLIEEPPEVELKDLPSHLEYAFLEGTDKLPVIISKELKDEENSVLLKYNFSLYIWYMSTRSSARNLFPPLDNPKLTIRRRTRVDPNLLNEFEMVTNGNGDDVLPPGGGDLPVLDLRTMEELCQPTLNGRGGPVSSIAIQATNFGLKNDMIQQVQNSYQFHGLPGGTFMKSHPEECYDLIENMPAHHNDWDTFVQRSESSSSITSSFDPEIVALKAEMAKINKNLMKVLQINQQVKAITHNCETCGGPHSYNDCPSTIGQNLELIEPVEAPVSAPKPNPKPSIPYPSRLHDQKLRDKANDQKKNFFQIFQDLNFNIRFMDALILMPKFGLIIKILLTNKDKLFELARTPLNEHCSVVLLKKLPEKLGDPDKFLISCDFLGMDACLADLDASINLMPLSVWNKLSFPELSPT